MFKIPEGHQRLQFHIGKLATDFKTVLWSWSYTKITFYFYSVTMNILSLI